MLVLGAVGLDRTGSRAAGRGCARSLVVVGGDHVGAGGD